eukprot:354463-Chlamydomonas_euryale.AAC.4
MRARVHMCNARPAACTPQTTGVWHERAQLPACRDAGMPEKMQRAVRLCPACLRRHAGVRLARCNDALRLGAVGNQGREAGANLDVLCD